jgi:hypothetical protein
MLLTSNKVLKKIPHVFEYGALVLVTLYSGGTECQSGEG